MILTLYHKDRPDGFYAARVVATYLRFYSEPQQYMPVTYGEDPPSLCGVTGLYIVDFSYPRETLLAMFTQLCKTPHAHTFALYDHHKTAEADLEGLKEELLKINKEREVPIRFVDIVFDKTECGATLAWKNLLEDTNWPMILNYIKDRDLWLKKLKHTDEVHAAINARGFDDITPLDRNQDPTDKLIAEGTAIQSFKKQCIKRAMEWVCVGILRGNRVVYGNVTDPALISEACHEMLQQHPDRIAMAYSIDPEQVYCSLRSADDRPDVSEIARHFGGGGHRNAAGFKMSIPEFAWRFWGLEKLEKHDHKV